MTDTAAPPTTILHAAARDDMHLDEALGQAALRDGVALLATPRHYHVARMTDGWPYPSGGAGVPLEDVFEARVFNPGAELRWLHTGDGRGRAVLLTEDETRIPESFAERPEPITADEALRGEYLLWGRATGNRDGWTTLATARIGTLAIPVIAADGRRVRLLTREYVTYEPSHGNAYVAEERLLYLEQVAAPTNHQGAAS